MLRGSDPTPRRVPAKLHPAIAKRTPATRLTAVDQTVAQALCSGVWLLRHRTRSQENTRTRFIPSTDVPCVHIQFHVALREQSKFREHSPRTARAGHQANSSPRHQPTLSDPCDTPSRLTNFSFTPSQRKLIPTLVFSAEIGTSILLTGRVELDQSNALDAASTSDTTSVASSGSNSTASEFDSSVSSSGSTDNCTPRRKTNNDEFPSLASAVPTPVPTSLSAPASTVVSSLTPRSTLIFSQSAMAAHCAVDGTPHSPVSSNSDDSLTPPWKPLPPAVVDISATTEQIVLSHKPPSSSALTTQSLQVKSVRFDDTPHHQLIPGLKSLPSSDFLAISSSKDTQEQIAEAHRRNCTGSCCAKDRDSFFQAKLLELSHLSAPAIALPATIIPSPLKPLVNVSFTSIANAKDSVGSASSSSLQAHTVSLTPFSSDRPQFTSGPLTTSFSTLPTPQPTAVDSRHSSLLISPHLGQMPSASGVSVPIIPLTVPNFESLALPGDIPSAVWASGRLKFVVESEDITSDNVSMLSSADLGLVHVLHKTHGFQLTAGVRELVLHCLGQSYVFELLLQE